RSRTEVAPRVPLVLLPALLCDGDLYRAQIDALGDIADARVIVASESSLAKSAQVVLAQAPPRFALGGTSAGGNLALEVLATAPERVVGFWLTGTNAAAHSDPAGARGLSERARGGEIARIVVVEDSGHLPTLEHPAAATLGIREWLTAL